MRFNSIVLSLLAAVPSALAALNGRCSYGVKGICINTTTCSNYSGSPSTGNCPSDPNNVKCCSNIPCKYNGIVGSCMFTSDCTGQTVSGLCPGGTNFKCCIPSVPSEVPTGSIVRTIPDGMGNVFSHMGWQMITSTSSAQYKLRAAYGMNFDSQGFGKINGKYVVAVTTWYGNVGDTLKVDFANGQSIDAVIGDIKNQNDAGCNQYGHMNGQCVIEFVVDKTGGFLGYNGDKTATNQLTWLKGNRVTKVTNTGHLPF